MERQRLKSHLEVSTNIAVLVAAVMLLGNFAWVHLAKQPIPRAEVGLKKGEQFSSIPGVDYGNSSKTLIIALSSKCEHCTETIPFVKHLWEASIENNVATRIVAVFPESPEEVWRYIGEKDLRLDTIPGINFRDLNLPGTPSAVLLDNQGKILNFWIGKPSDNAEQEIIGAITIKG